MTESNGSRRPRPGVRTVALGVGGALAGALAGEVKHRWALAGSEEYARLRDPLAGDRIEATSADGTRLHAVVTGPKAAPTIVLVPGWTEELRYFGPLARVLLDAGFRVVAYDLRGQGFSAHSASGDYALARYGEDVEAVLAATADGRPDVIVAGHSMGGMSIAAWAADHDVSARVRAAALMNTGMHDLIAASLILPTRLHPEIRNQLGVYVVMGNPLPMVPVSTGISRRVLRHMAFGPHATEAQVAFYEPMLRACPPAVRAAAGRAMSEMDLLHALPRLTVPTLVLAGELDRLTPPSHSQLIARALPQLVELLVLPEIGHMAPLEATDQLAEALSSLAVGVGIHLRAAAA